MQINTQNAKKIDAYINDFPNSDLGYFERVRIQDRMTELHVYRLPLHLLYYNIQNGRFATDYLALKKQLNRELNPENPDDVKKIENMLVNQSPAKTQWLKNNIKEKGQDDPGIITNDGYVINGNRRMSVLTLLAKEDPTFGYMNVGRLPPNVTESDVYKIELGKQMAREQKLDYGPINELLKIKHGLDSGLTKEGIATTIGFSVEEIEEKIDRLSLIQEYLEFIGDPNNFKIIEDNNEHFVELQNYIFSKRKQKKQDFSPLELLNIKQVAFATIKGGIQHRELRKIPKFVNNAKIKPLFMEAKKYAQKDIEKTLEIFDVCSTKLKAEEDRDKPAKLLESILVNLEVLDLSNPELKKDEYRTLIKKISSFLEDFKKLI